MSTLTARQQVSVSEGRQLAAVPISCRNCVRIRSAFTSSRLQRQRQSVPGRQHRLLVRAEEAASPAGEPIEKSLPSLPAVKDVQEIMDLLPHRFPFLLLDRVVEFEAGKYAVGYKNITVNDNFFPGHFPQRAIMPGVLQVEAMAQLGGIVMMDPENKSNNFFFGGVERCKWRKPVVPGDTLMMRVELLKYNKRFGMAKLDAKAYVGSSLVCEAELTLIMGK